MSKAQFAKTKDKLCALVKIAKCVECETFLGGNGYVNVKCGHFTCSVCTQSYKERSCALCGLVGKNQLWRSNDMMKVARLCEELSELLHLKTEKNKNVQQRGETEKNLAQLNAKELTSKSATKSLNAINALRSIQKQNDEIVPGSSEKDTERSRDFLDSIVETDVIEKAPAIKKALKKRSKTPEKENRADIFFAPDTPKSNENASEQEKHKALDDQPMIKRPRSAEMAKPKNQVTRRRKTGSPSRSTAAGNAKTNEDEGSRSVKTDLKKKSPSAKREVPKKRSKASFKKNDDNEEEKDAETAADAAGSEEDEEKAAAAEDCGLDTSLSKLKANDLLMKRNAKGETPLQVAVIKGDYELAESMLKEGCTPNVKDYAGWTPLHEACHHGNEAMAALLLEHGACVDTPGFDNYTPLHDAVESGHVDCARLLLLHGASLHTRTSFGKTAEQLCPSVNGPMKTLLQNPPTPASVLSFSSQSPVVMQSSVARRPPPISRPVVLCTGLTDRQKSTLKLCSDELKWTIATSFDKNVTHVVTSVNEDGACARTLKYLQAVLCGAWIVTFDWVKSCLEDGRQVEEDAFEVSGAGTTPRSFAPQKGRLNREQQRPGLLSHCHFFLRGDFTPPSLSRDALVQLVTLGGGELLHREPRMETICQSEDYPRVPYHARPMGVLAHCCNYVVCDKAKGCHVTVTGSVLAEASPDWLVECIANFTLLD